VILQPKTWDIFTKHKLMKILISQITKQPHLNYKIMLKQQI